VVVTVMACHSASGGSREKKTYVWRCLNRRLDQFSLSPPLVAMTVVVMDDDDVAVVVVVV
jgi:hypothetical protein